MYEIVAVLMTYYDYIIYIIYIIIVSPTIKQWREFRKRVHIFWEGNGQKMDRNQELWGGK